MTREAAEYPSPWHLPADDRAHFDAVARERVLANIREATPSRWTAKVDELRDLARDGTHISLARYLDETGLDLEDVYAGSKSWSDLLAGAGQPILEAGPHEVALRRACGRILHMDDLERLETYQRLLGAPSPPNPEGLGPRERRLVDVAILPFDLASGPDRAKLDIGRVL